MWEKKDDGLEEERRLLYVAATRATDRLYLCCKAESPDTLAQFDTTKSRFLEALLRSEPTLFEEYGYQDIDDNLNRVFLLFYPGFCVGSIRLSWAPDEFY